MQEALCPDTAAPRLLLAIECGRRTPRALEPCVFALTRSACSYPVPSRYTTSNARAFSRQPKIKWDDEVRLHKD